MRLLAASDIHGDHGIYRWLVVQVIQQQADLLLLAGDLLGYAPGYETIEESQRADAAEIVSILRDLTVPVWYVMGNDDEVELGVADGQFQPLHARRRDCGRFNFVGFQYSLPFMGGVNEKPEERIASDIALLERSMDERTVLLTHCPAAGVLDTTPLGPAGSRAIRDSVLRRAVHAHIHGHVHGSFGRDGRHFNVAAGGRTRAMLIDACSLEHLVLEEAGRPGIAGSAEASDSGSNVAHSGSPIRTKADQ